MPELPEVQTVVSQLAKKVVGKTLADFKSTWPKKVLTPYAPFRKTVKGAKIVGTRRIGKHILIDLNNEHTIVIHLKMTGHLLYKDKQNKNARVFTEDPMNGFIHHVFTFNDESTLEFSDMRKFAWLRLLKTAEVESVSSIAGLGIDALSSKLTTAKFYALLSARRARPVGSVLLEQNIIAGVGNIYRSEALFRSGILPTRIIGDIRETEWQKLLPAIKGVLREAVRLRGTTDGDFRDTDGMGGAFQRKLYVYGRTGKPCKVCGTIILRQKLGSRSIFFCSVCQK